MGATVSTLPHEGDWVKANNQQYYKSGGVYYQALYSGNGVVYKVVEDPTT